MTYRIEFLRSAVKEFSGLATADQKRIRARIDALASDPRPSGCRKLSGVHDGYYRVRVGHYRIVYDVRDDILVVIVIRVRHRSDAY